MTWFIVGVSMVLAAILMAQWFVVAKPKAIIRAVFGVSVTIAILFGIFMVFSGRLAWAWVGLMALLPWISRLRLLNNLMKAMRGPTMGQHSEVRTRFVHMILMHDSGEMDGEVQEGPHVGRKLSQMELAELVQFYHTAILEDQQSASVIESYLDRTHGAIWREAGKTHTSNYKSTVNKMTGSEARDILGVAIGADKEEIKKAHRSLMQKYHPDRGGSDYLAARINEAKDVLLEIMG